MPVVVYKRQINKKKGDSKYAQWSDKQRLEAVASYMVIGNMTLVAEAVNIPLSTLKHWKMETWWKELEAQIRQQKRIEVSGKLSKVIDKAFKEVEDRLENGDYVYTKDGVRRIRVNAKTAGDILSKSIDKQIILDKIQETPVIKEEDVMDRLKNIEQRLIEASKIRKPIIIEGEVTNVE